MVTPGADDTGNLERREGIFGWAYRIRLNDKVSLTSTISQFTTRTYAVRQPSRHIDHTTIHNAKKTMPASKDNVPAMSDVSKMFLFSILIHLQSLIIAYWRTFLVHAAYEGKFRKGLSIVGQ